MAGPLRHLGELAQAQVRRRTAPRADAEALTELEARPLALPAGLEVEWLGVSATGSRTRGIPSSSTPTSPASPSAI
ncbi:MAG TPA: hypothetical protein VMH33_07170 [Solirubrobacterales bacterium]|nr:hypothetical protein [Solirubrobacterales bacterium]